MSASHWDGGTPPFPSALSDGRKRRVLTAASASHRSERPAAGYGAALRQKEKHQTCARSHQWENDPRTLWSQRARTHTQI